MEEVTSIAESAGERWLLARSINEPEAASSTGNPDISFVTGDFHRGTSVTPYTISVNYQKCIQNERNFYNGPLVIVPLKTAQVSKINNYPFAHFVLIFNRLYLGPFSC